MLAWSRAWLQSVSFLSRESDWSNLKPSHWDPGIVEVRCAESPSPPTSVTSFCGSWSTGQEHHSGSVHCLLLVCSVSLQEGTRCRVRQQRVVRGKHLTEKTNSDTPQSRTYLEGNDPEPFNTIGVCWKIGEVHFNKAEVHSNNMGGYSWFFQKIRTWLPLLFTPYMSQCFLPIWQMVDIII